MLAALSALHWLDGSTRNLLRLNLLHHPHSLTCVATFYESVKDTSETIESKEGYRLTEWTRKDQSMLGFISVICIHSIQRTYDIRRNPMKSASDSDILEFGNLPSVKPQSEEWYSALKHKGQNQTRQANIQTQTLQQYTKTEEDFHIAHTLCRVPCD